MLSNKLAWSLAKKERVTLTSANVVKQVTGLGKKTKGGLNSKRESPTMKKISK